MKPQMRWRVLDDGLRLGEFEQDAVQDELGLLSERGAGANGQGHFRPVRQSRRGRHDQVC